MTRSTTRPTRSCSRCSSAQGRRGSSGCVRAHTPRAHRSRAWCSRSPVSASPACGCSDAMACAGSRDAALVLLNPSFSKSTHRGQKRPICEEQYKANFLSIIRTCENADISASEQSLPTSRTHISALFVPLTSFFEKKGGRRFRRWPLMHHKSGRD